MRIPNLVLRILIILQKKKYIFFSIYLNQRKINCRKMHNNHKACLLSFLRRFVFALRSLYIWKGGRFKLRKRSKSDRWLRKKKKRIWSEAVTFFSSLCVLFTSWLLGFLGCFLWVKRGFRRHHGFSNFPCVDLLTCNAEACYLFFSFAILFAATQRRAAGAQVVLFRRLVWILPERRHGCSQSLRFLQEQLPPLQNFIMGQGKLGKRLTMDDVNGQKLLHFFGKW